MKRRRILSLLGSLGAAVAVLALTVGLLAAQEGPNEPDEASMEGRDVALVVDTTASMQPELDALAAAWASSRAAGFIGDDLGLTYHLIAYKDRPRFLGSTAETAIVQGWLNQLEAQAGGDCADAMLQALAGVARGAPGSRALVLSDAAPQGNRGNLAFIMNKLIQQGVDVFPVISGWCDESEFTRSSMLSLARMTGGFPYLLEQPEDTQVAAEAALSRMSMGDKLLSDNSSIDGVKIYPLSLDSTVTTLGVDDYECPTKYAWCLTCVLSIPAMQTLDLAVPDRLQIRDPQGNLVEAGDPGVTILETGSGVSYRIDVQQLITETAAAGTWEIIVDYGALPPGTGAILDVVAESGLHLEYLGRPVMRANRPTPVRVKLTTDAGMPTVVDNSVSFALKRADHEDEIDLFNIAPVGGGIYEGSLMVEEGIYYFIVQGELTDGSAFQRVAPVPIRVRGVSVSGKTSGQQVPGSSRTNTFTVANDGTSAKTYALYVDSSQEWANTEDVPETMTVQAGERKQVKVTVTVPPDAAPGTVDETSLTAVEVNDLAASDTLFVNTAVVDELTAFMPAIIRP